ncbi:DeoR/GlpR transcriptional regulator [Martelella lutilitoris]|uniref:DeoR/GlpR transcriptional regulator n=1 Tax=Martelella lutilitoris TaxID=2583532 RepID=A0A5C4JWP4_9HYPH|nr:DeoR/GlpR family DNA-binding transcription regulator [Martelella lutilitoris]TNB49868.1 DeoR/GlpR transcriptional regulator [Martelella lutilitoris]
MHLIRERQDIILKRLNTGNRVLAADLATEFAVSEDTIRRDLRELAARGLCERVYGGALPVAPASGPLKARDNKDDAEKQALGRLLASEIRDGMSVFLDASSTNIAAARALPETLGGVIVTNAPAIAAALDGHQTLDLIMIGGRIHREVGGAIGAGAIEDLQAFHFDLCLLGACGIDVEAGLTCFHYEDALFKREAAACARRVVTAMTAAKFATRAPCSVIALDALDALAVPETLDAAARAALEETGLELIGKGAER